MINFQEKCHWYDCRGALPEPKHDSDLRKARKANLYPSITSVDKDVFRNVGLERYALNQLAEAAANHPRMAHESVKDYGNRIYRISCEHRDAAADFGKEVHDAIEHYPQYPLNSKLHAWLDRFATWHNIHIECPLEKEKILVNHTLGMAGTCDNISMGKGPFAGKIVIPDYKTQDVKVSDKGKKTPAFYDSWCRQLSFYTSSYSNEGQEALLTHNNVVCVSLVIDSNEPDDPFMHVWSDEEVAAAYEDVALAAYRYFKSRDFWPHLDGGSGLRRLIAGFMNK